MLKKLSFKEKVLYFVAIVVASLGIAMIILGLIADNLAVDNPLDKAQNKFFMPFRFFGLIILAIAIIYFFIVLLIYARKVDRVIEKETRRKQRLDAMLNDNKDKETILVKDGKVVNEVKKEDKDEDIELRPTNDKGTY